MPTRQGHRENIRTVDPTAKAIDLARSRAVSILSTDGLTLPTQIWYPSQNPSSELHRYGDLKKEQLFKRRTC